MLPNWTQCSRQVNLMFGNEENLNDHSKCQVNLTFGSKGLNAYCTSSVVSIPYCLKKRELHKSDWLYIPLELMNLPITCVASPSVTIICSHFRQNKRTVLLIFRATVQLRDTSTRDTLSSLSPKYETEHFISYYPF
jgi:hypothetical protein